ncbi:MAG: 50S ribosomal protein L18 [Patescibacteria group bacterium]
MKKNIKKEKNKKDRIKRIKAKIRANISGTKEIPRLSVFRSNKFIYAQIIDDTVGKTIVQANDSKITTGTKNERAKQIGKKLAEIAKEKKISKVVFDRNGFKYIGRVKLLADEVRVGGLIF